MTGPSTSPPTPTHAAASRPDWVVPLLLVLLSLVPSVAGVARLGDVAAAAAGGPITPENARFVAAPIPVVLHILAAVPFGLLGALQFSATLRARGSRWHRLAGRLLLPAGFVVALTGLWMARAYPWPVFDGLAVQQLRIGFGGWMLVALLAATDAIGRRDFRAHGEWMTRAYAVALGAGTQVLTHLPWFLLVGELTVGPRALLMGAGWVINVAVAEWVIHRARLRTRKTAPTIVWRAAGARA